MENPPSRGQMYEPLDRKLTVVALNGDKWFFIFPPLFFSDGAKPVEQIGLDMNQVWSDRADAYD